MIRLNPTQQENLTMELQENPVRQCRTVGCTSK
jgi:hypothetical protein